MFYTLIKHGFLTNQSAHGISYIINTNYATLSSGILWNIAHVTCIFSIYTPAFIGERAYQENTSNKWDIPWYSTRERCITILYHAIENVVTNTIKATYTRGTMRRLNVIPWNMQSLQRFSSILIGCI